MGLKFMAIIGTNGKDPERELGNYIIDKIYGILLRMVIINPQRSNSGRIIPSHILETTDGLAIRFLEFQKFNVYLNMMPGSLLFYCWVCTVRSLDCAEADSNHFS